MPILGPVQHSQPNCRVSWCPSPAKVGEFPHGQFSRRPLDPPPFFVSLSLAGVNLFLSSPITCVAPITERICLHDNISECRSSDRKPNRCLEESLLSERDCRSAISDSWLVYSGGGERLVPSTSCRDWGRRCSGVVFAGAGGRKERSLLFPLLGPPPGSPFWFPAPMSEVVSGPLAVRVTYLQPRGHTDACMRVCS